MRLYLRGTHAYWSHPDLVLIARRWGRLPEAQAKRALASYGGMRLESLSGADVEGVRRALEAAGFAVLEGRGGAFSKVFEIQLPVAREVAYLKALVDTVSRRLDALGAGAAVPQTAPAPEPVLETPKAEEAIAAPAARSAEAGDRAGAAEGTGMESRIGKYWLSRLGVFSFVIGIALFINYSFQSIGAWGKIATAAALSAGLIAGGNRIGRRAGMQRWAMALLGGGWALAYVTVYAAFALPQTQVIRNPVLGLLLLLAVAAGAITQSLRARSAVLVFFSYFLAYVAINLFGVTLRSLAASLLLAASLVAVSRTLRMSWFMLGGLAAVYLTHFFWVEPSIYFISPEFLGEESVVSAMIFPWTDSNWALYPLIEPARSFLHQGFLAVYWALFALIGLMRPQGATQEPRSAAALSLANNAIFVFAYIHHLHVYFPELKAVFLCLAGLAFLVMHRAHRGRSGDGAVAGVHLASSLAAVLLAVPLSLDGPWVGYAWAALSCLSLRLGLEQGSRVLRAAGWAGGLAAALNLVSLAYADNALLFTFVMPVRAAWVHFTIAASAFAFNGWQYHQSASAGETEKRRLRAIFFIAAVYALSAGLLIGGWRSAVSVIALVLGAMLAEGGMRLNDRAMRVGGLSLAVLAAIRICGVDCSLDVMEAARNWRDAVRFIIVGLSIAGLAAFAERLRRWELRVSRGSFESRLLLVLSALLAIAYLYDEGISGWASLLWSVAALPYLAAGFAVRDRCTRWVGLGILALVVLRVLMHDMAKLEVGVRILSFLGLGAIFIGASMIYSSFAKRLE